MLTMLHMVEAQQSLYILAQADVMSFAFATLSTLEYFEPPHSAASQIPYVPVVDIHTHTHTHICNIMSVSTPSAVLSNSLH